MTKDDTRAALASGMLRLDRKLHARKHDSDALRTAKLWLALKKQHPELQGVDFARLVVDETVPNAFDDYWDHPAFHVVLYLLFRAGAQLTLSPIKSRKGGNFRKREARGRTVSRRLQRSSRRAAKHR